MPGSWWRYDLVQLALVGLAVFSLTSLYAAVHVGLLFSPDTLVSGNGSSAEVLRWYADRSEGALPQPWVISLPVWAWRAAVLVWALWLARSLWRWMPWAWRTMSSEGWWRVPERVPGLPSRPANPGK